MQWEYKRRFFGVGLDFVWDCSIVKKSEILLSDSAFIFYVPLKMFLAAEKNS